MKSHLSTTCFSRNFGIARIHNLNLTHHLTHNNLEVLVIDLHTLHPVYLLDLVHNILLYLGGSFDGQNIGRGNGSVRKGYYQPSRSHSPEPGSAWKAEPGIS